MNDAIRTVSETDDIRTIEGRIAYGGPFKGRDTYGTTFTARTDWALRMHPSGIPVLYNHGFDPDFGMDPIGFTEPTAGFRSESDGLWVKMQIDKRHRYYEERVKPLLDGGMVGISQGSSEHSIDIDARTGEVRSWPMHEVSITPTESNPWNIVAARTADFVTILAARKDVDPNVGGGVDRDKLPAEDFAGLRAAAWDVSDGARILAEMLSILGQESDEPEQAAKINAAIDLWNEWLVMERAEIGTESDGDRQTYTTVTTETVAYMSGVRAGARNSAADQAHVNAMHDNAVAMHTHAVALGASNHADDETIETTPDDEPAEDAARTGETPPATVKVVERADPEAVRARMLALAARTGSEVAARMTS